MIPGMPRSKISRNLAGSVLRHALALRWGLASVLALGCLAADPTNDADPRSSARSIAARANSYTMRIAPHAQVVETDAFTVVLRTQDKDAASCVSVHAYPSATTLVPIATLRVCTESSYKKAAFSGLQPNTLYWYDAWVETTSGWQGTARSVVKTASATSTNQAPIRLGVLGDVQDGVPLCGVPNVTQRQRYAKAVMAAHPDFLVQVGDLTSDGTNEENIRKFWDEFAAHLRHSEGLYQLDTPIAYAYGNHEFGTSPNGLNNGSPTCTVTDAFVAFPRDGVSGDPTYFAYTYGNLHVVHLNSEYCQSVGYYDTYPNPEGTSLPTPTTPCDPALAVAQRNWLRSDLSEANLNPSVDWILVVHHFPYFSNGDVEKRGRNFCNPIWVHEHGMGGFVTDGRQYDIDSLGYLNDIYAYYNVDAVFSGHTHAYERLEEKRNQEDLPLEYIVVGGGGVALTHMPTAQENHLPPSVSEAASASGDSYFGTLSVAGDAALFVETRVDCVTGVTEGIDSVALASRKTRIRAGTLASGGAVVDGAGRAAGQRALR